MLFVNSLNFFSFLKIINFGETTVHVLSNKGLFYSFLLKILKLLGYNFIHETFFYGDILSSSGETIYMKSRRASSEMAFNYSEEVYNKLKEKNYHRSFEDELVLKSFISKRVLMEFEYFQRRIDYITNLKNYKKNTYLIINEPKLIESEFIKRNTKLNLEFYGTNFFSIVRQELKMFFIKVFSLINYLFFSKKISDHETTIGIATEPISFNTFERHYPHWTNKENFKNFIIINDTNQEVNITRDFLKRNNIKILGKHSLMYLPYIYRDYFAFDNSLKIKKHLIIQLKKLKMLSNGMLFILKKHRCNRFIFTEPQDFTSDAILMCKKSHKINTYCIQYSNIGYRTPLMISPVDKYLCFSKSYEKVLKWKNVSPKKFVSCGYSFINSKVDSNMILIKNKLSKIGVKKIISFFDESIQFDKWGLISYDSVKSEYEDLANFILLKKDYAVILKPQFMTNSLDIFESSIINKAIETKRFIEVKKGRHRNIITPQQVGSISNISISNLIGGTAGIEAALSGSTVFFTNPSKYKPHNYDIIDNLDLISNNLKEVLKKDINSLKYKNASIELIKQLVSSNYNISEVLKN
jgi:hypothetical protein